MEMSRRMVVFSACRYEKWAFWERDSIHVGFVGKRDSSKHHGLIPDLVPVD